MPTSASSAKLKLLDLGVYAASRGFHRLAHWAQTLPLNPALIRRWSLMAANQGCHDLAVQASRLATELAESGIRASNPEQPAGEPPLPSGAPVPTACERTAHDQATKLADKQRLFMSRIRFAWSQVDEPRFLTELYEEDRTSAGEPRLGENPPEPWQVPERRDL